MLNFSMFIKGINVSSEIAEEVVELLPKATYVSVFSKDVSELNSDLIDSVIAFGFTTDGVIGVARQKGSEAVDAIGKPKKPSSFINFKRPAITGAALLKARSVKARA